MKIDTISLIDNTTVDYVQAKRLIREIDAVCDGSPLPLKVDEVGYYAATITVRQIYSI